MNFTDQIALVENDLKGLNKEIAYWTDELAKLRENLKKLQEDLKAQQACEAARQGGAVRVLTSPYKNMPCRPNGVNDAQNAIQKVQQLIWNASKSIRWQ